MKNQIDLLVQLAKDYREFCLSSAIKVRMNNHNVLRGVGADFNWSKQDKKEISIYFNGATCAVRFDQFELAFYSGKITFPYHFNETSLNETYYDCLDYLDYMKMKIPMMKEAEKKQKKLTELEMALKEVARLEKEIR